MRCLVCNNLSPVKGCPEIGKGKTDRDSVFHPRGSVANYPLMLFDGVSIKNKIVPGKHKNHNILWFTPNSSGF
jgi:hypothetical protein